MPIVDKRIKKEPPAIFSRGRYVFSDYRTESSTESDSNFDLGLAVAAATAAAAHSADKIAQRAVLSEAVCESQEKGPAATAESARREYATAIRARIENEQDNENPKQAIAL